MRMAWEDHVSQVSVESRPRDAYELARQWGRLGEDLSTLVSSLAQVHARTLDDAGEPLPPGLTARSQVAYAHAYQGRTWTGAAADAYRAQVRSLADAVDDLRSRVVTFSGALTRCADHLSTGIAGIPVPIYNDRDLPGGTDVEDVVRNRDMDPASANTFAQRLAADRAKGTEYYRAGGFKARADETLWKPWTGDGVALNGREQGDRSGGEIAVLEGDPENADYLHRRDTWYAHNESTAAEAHTKLADAYDSEPTALGPPGRQYETAANVAAPGQNGAVDTPGDPFRHGENVASGSFATSLGGAAFSPSRDSSSFHPPDVSSGDDFTPGDADPGTGLAGAGLGEPGSISGGGIGPIVGRNPTFDGGADGPSGVLSPPGRSWRTGPIGGRSGGAGAARVPGLMTPGSSSAGPGRSQMSPLTSPLRAIGEMGEIRGAAGGAAGTGMLPMGAGGPGARSESSPARTSWLVEDDDPWGLDEEPPAGVIR